MWKSSIFILVSAFLLNEHLSSGNLMPCVELIEQLPVEILYIPIDILYDIKDLFMYTYCHLGYLTEFMEYVTGWNWCDVYNTPSCCVHIEKPMDCYEVQKNCHTESGVYTIWPKSDVIGSESIDVYCDMDTDGGGWTVLLKRGNFSPQENFYRDWNGYKIGFGDLNRDFWLGNDKMYALTNQKHYQVRFDIEGFEGKKAFAVYETFWIEGEASLYKLHIENCTAGNVVGPNETEATSMSYHNNRNFSTFDKDNDDSLPEEGDTNCAAEEKGGWWFGYCSGVVLTSLYKPGVEKRDAFVWYMWDKRGLAAADMKLRPA